MARKNYIPVKLQDDENIVDVNNEEVTEIAEVKEGFNVKEFAKKHWKKAAIGLGVVGAGILGFVLGKKGEDDVDLDLLEYPEDDEDSDDETEEE